MVAFKKVKAAWRKKHGASNAEPRLHMFQGFGLHFKHSFPRNLFWITIFFLRIYSV